MSFVHLHCHTGNSLIDGVTCIRNPRQAFFAAYLGIPLQYISIGCVTAFSLGFP